MFGEQGIACFCTDDDLAAHRRLYNLEAYLRYLVRWELIGLFGIEWLGKLGSIKKDALKTMEDERQLGVIDYDPRNPLSYTVAKDLQTTIDGIIWDSLSAWMPRADILQAEFEILRALRNKSAHLRRLTPRDLRSLDRIESTFTHATAQYREVRRQAVDMSSIRRPEVPSPLRPGLKKWFADADAVDGKWTDLKLSSVGTYLRIDARLRVGAFHPAAVGEAVKSAETDAFFLSMDDPTGRLSAYVPACLTKDQASKVFAALQNMRTVGDTLQEEPFEVPFFDFVFPIHVELPAALRL
ncbi:hypothetical protein D3C80_767210 [compost metagenome]